MGWFTDDPEDLFKLASAAINRWWDSIDGQQATGETLVHELGPLTVILSPSIGAMRTEYHARHGETLPDNCAGVTWSDGSKWEIYLPYKVTKAGNRIINKLAAGDELGHVLLGAGIDDCDKAEFYNV